VLLSYSVPILLGSAIFFLCYYLKSNGTPLTDFYQKNMRSSLFAGFLTLGSFLLSLKTGIVIKIKESVYDKEGYQSKFATGLVSGSPMSVYGPLRRLSKMLSSAVLSALVTAVFQLTIGLLDYWWAVAICLSSATIAISLLLFAFMLIQINMHKWFDYLENEAAKARTNANV
jgi:hypothetical protein